MVGMICSSCIVVRLPGEEDSAAGTAAARLGRRVRPTLAGLAASARPGGAADDADHHRVAFLEAGRDLGVRPVGQAGRHAHRNELAVLDGDHDVAVAPGAADDEWASVRAGLGVGAGRARRGLSTRRGLSARLALLVADALAVLGPLAALTALALGPLALALTGRGLAAGASLTALALAATAADETLLEGRLGEGERLVRHDEDVVALVGGDGDLGGHPRVERRARDRLDGAGHRVVDHVVGRGAG